MGMYGKIGRMDDARKVFDEMRERNVVSWSAMIFLGIPATHSKKMELRNFNYSAKTFQPVRVTGQQAMKTH